MLYWALWCGDVPGETYWRGPLTVDQLRYVFAAGGATLDLSLRDARRRKLSLRDVLAQPSKREVPWGKIFLGVGAVALGVVAILEALRDPEPRRIEEIANEHLGRGSTVFADIKGWPQPPVLNGSRPDLFVVTTRGKEVAVEFENDKSIGRAHAKGQITNLSRWAARSERRTFKVEVVDGGRGGKRA